MDVHKEGEAPPWKLLPVVSYFSPVWPTVHYSSFFIWFPRMIGTVRVGRQFLPLSCWQPGYKGWKDWTEGCKKSRKSSLFGFGLRIWNPFWGFGLFWQKIQSHIKSSIPPCKNKKLSYFDEFSSPPNIFYSSTTLLNTFSPLNLPIVPQIFLWV